MIHRSTAIPVCISIVVLLVGIFMFVFGSFGQTTEKPRDQVGRYSVAVNGESAYLVDSVTGCVWRKPPQLPFILISVEGLIEVPPSPKEEKDQERKIPARCQ